MSRRRRPGSEATRAEVRCDPIPGGIVSVEVLKTKADVEQARARLEERGISCLGMAFDGRSPWRRLMGDPPASVGDRVKSWDILRTVEHLERSHPRSARVLDLGAYSSEILCTLHRAGYERLTGIDLNPRVRRMPFADGIRWEVGNFLQAPFRDGAFDVITSVSVIEHGFDAPVLFREMARLLSPGGTFIASFDYWPEKIDTRGTKFFGMDWLIFSREDVEAAIGRAREFGFTPVGALALDASERTIQCAGRDYTFAWMALRRD
jgi:SAM-dependent methyltransferase